MLSNEGRVVYNSTQHVSMATCLSCYLLQMWYLQKWISLLFLLFDLQRMRCLFLHLYHQVVVEKVVFTYTN